MPRKDFVQEDNQIAPSEHLDKAENVAVFIPFIRIIKGPLSLRGRPTNQPYNVSIGENPAIGS